MSIHSVSSSGSTVSLNADHDLLLEDLAYKAIDELDMKTLQSMIDHEEFPPHLAIEAMYAAAQAGCESVFFSVIADINEEHPDFDSQKGQIFSRAHELAREGRNQKIINRLQEELTKLGL